MTKPSKKMPSPEGAQLKQKPDPDLRILDLPPHLRDIPSCTGIPDLFGTYCLNIFLTLLVSAFFFGFLYAIFYDPAFHRIGLIGFILTLAILACMVWLVVIFIRGIRRPGVWFEVDHVGFRYGNGKSPDSAVPPQGRFEWNEIVGNPAEKEDVRYDSGSKARSAKFEFWRRVKRDSSEKCGVPRNLMNYDSERDGIRCVRFKNHHSLMIAILCGMAHQGLRIHLNTFVAAGIHPETWQKLRTPTRGASAIFLVLFLADCLALEIWGKLGCIAGSSILLVALAFYFKEGKYLLSPDLKDYPKGRLTFRIHNPDSQ
jgi:hypothetical protein